MKFKVTYSETHIFEKIIEAPDQETAEDMIDKLLKSEMPTEDNGWSGPSIEWGEWEVNPTTFTGEDDGQNDNSRQL